jgi:hypothetical protein
MVLSKRSAVPARSRLAGDFAWMRQGQHAAIDAGDRSFDRNGADASAIKFQL